MSGLVNKAKEILTPNKGHETTTGPSTTGHTTTGHDTVGHTTGTHTTTGHTTGTHGTHGQVGAAPVHDASTLSHGTHTGGYGHTTGTATTGPHSSNVANKLDPRVDSDADHRNNPTSVVGRYGQTGTGTTSAYGHGTTTGATTGTAGPHSSNIANKLDPQVDSDADHRNNPASAAGGYGQTGTAYGATSGTTGTTGTTGTSTTTGPHSSNLANKLDPRVDSDASHGAGHTGVGGNRF
ncbi:hypothetical protein ABEF95_005815 [Exophiala dermatitidis]